LGLPRPIARAPLELVFQSTSIGFGEHFGELADIDVDCCPASFLDYPARHATPIRDAAMRLGSTFCSASKVLIFSPLYFWNLGSSCAYSSIMNGQCHQQKTKKQPLLGEA
jgi:hypothetical protein